MKKLVLQNKYEISLSFISNRMKLYLIFLSDTSKNKSYTYTTA